MNHTENTIIFRSSIIQPHTEFIKNWDGIVVGGRFFYNVFSGKKSVEPIELFFVKSNTKSIIDVDFVGKTIVNVYSWMHKKHPNTTVEIKTDDFMNVVFSVNDFFVLVHLQHVYESVNALIRNFDKTEQKIVVDPSGVYCLADLHKKILNNYIHHRLVHNASDFVSPRTSVTFVQLLINIEEFAKNGYIILPHESSLFVDAGGDWNYSSFLARMKQHAQHVIEEEVYHIELSDQLFPATPPPKNMDSRSKRVPPTEDKHYCNMRG
jgi:hypothetical protein